MAQLLREIRMLAGLYIFGGVWLLGFALVLFWSMSVQTGYTPGGIAGFLSGLAVIFLIIVLLVSTAFLLTAFFMLKREASSRKSGLVLSGLVVAFTVVPFLPGSIIGVVRYALDHPNLQSYLNAGFAISFPALIVANIICLYYLTRPKVKAYLTK